MITKCSICSKQFYARPSDIARGNGKFCSRKCYGSYKKNQPSSRKGTGQGKTTKNCAACGKSFSFWPSAAKYSVRKYCSHKCARSTRINTLAPAYKAGIKRIGKGYIHLYAPYHPYNVNGYVRRSHLIAEKQLKRFLSSGEVIHHINENVEDDRIENLYLFPNQAEHARYHIFSKNGKCEIIFNSNIS